MEGNSDVPSDGVPATGAVKQNTTPFFSQSDTRSRAVWLMYLVKVLGTDRREIYKWRSKSLQQWAGLGTMLLRYTKAMCLDLHRTDCTRM